MKYLREEQVWKMISEVIDLLIVRGIGFCNESVVSNFLFLCQCSSGDIPDHLRLTISGIIFVRCIRLNQNRRLSCGILLYWNKERLLFLCGVLDWIKIDGLVAVVLYWNKERLLCWTDNLLFRIRKFRMIFLKINLMLVPSKIQNLK